MGKAASTIPKPKNDSPLMAFMRRKYGPNVLICMPIWYELGFPQDGSLSLNRLQRLQDNFKKQKEIWYKKKSGTRRRKYL